MDTEGFPVRPGAKHLPPASTAQLEYEAVPHRWTALAVLLVGGFLPALDFFIVNVALPSIRQGLGAGNDVIQLVISGFAAAYAVLLVMGGRLGDLYGRNRMFMIGMAGFALCSAWCGLAWSPHALVMGRLLQGATAAIMAPQVAASIHLLFAHEEKAHAFSFYGASIGLSAIAGQILAGALIWANIWGLGWRTIFLINVPIVAITLAAAVPLLRESRPSTNAIQPLDITGSILLFLGLGALVCSLIEGRQENWSIWSFVLMGSCPVLLAWFWRVEVRLAAHGGAPLIHPRLFAAPGFARGLGVTLLFYTMASFFLLYSIYLQAGLQFSAFHAGIGIVPFGIGYVAGSLSTPALLRGMGMRVTAFGLLIAAAGLSMLAAGVNSAGVLHLLMFTPGVFAIGFGQGVALPTLVRAVIQGAPADYAGAASGVVNSTLQIGCSLGVATVGSVFFAILAQHSGGLAAVAHAFTVALLCLAVLLSCASFLAWGLGSKPRDISSKPE
jgi:predicted MFS family arabinose efflux permease